MSDWNPDLYRRFEDERTRPARELLARVVLNEPKLIYDLGSLRSPPPRGTCGPRRAALGTG